MSKRRKILQKSPETRESHLLKHQIQSAVANPGWVYLKPSQPKSSNQNSPRQLMKHLIYTKVSQLANSQPKQVTRDHVREASHLPKPRGNHKSFHQRIKEVNQLNVHKHVKYQMEERPTRNKLRILKIQMTKHMNQSKNKRPIRIGARETREMSRCTQTHVVQDLKQIEKSRM